MTVKTEIMAAENSALPAQEKLHFKIYSNRILLFHNITVFTVLLIK